VLFVDLTSNDRLVGPTPLAFLVEKVYVAPLTLADNYQKIERPCYDDHDIQKSKELQSRGRPGVALVVLVIYGMTMLSFLRFEFKELVAKVTPISEWQTVVKEIANGERGRRQSSEWFRVCHQICI
jgi:hypothetical protein